MTVILEFTDGTNEVLGAERYLNRVHRRDPLLLKARVRLYGKEHFSRYEIESWRQVEMLDAQAAVQGNGAVA